MQEPSSRTGRQESSVFQDEEIVSRICAGECDLFELLHQRHTHRLYRIARAVLHDEIEAEDVVQETWLRALAHLDQFSGRGRFANWIGRIAVYEAFARARQRRRERANRSEADDMGRERTPADPERAASDREIRGFIEAAIDALPNKYRLVLVLRRIEGLSTAEVALCLGLSQLTVTSRLHRAKALLRNELLAVGRPAAPGGARVRDPRRDERQSRRDSEKIPINL